MRSAGSLARRATGLVLLASLVLAPASLGADESEYFTVMAVQVNEVGHVVFRLNDDLDNVWYVCEEHRRLHLSILLTALSTRREVKVYWTPYSEERTDRKVIALRVH